MWGSMVCCMLWNCRESYSHTLYDSSYHPADIFFDVKGLFVGQKQGQIHV